MTLNVRFDELYINNKSVEG